MKKIVSLLPDRLKTILFERHLALSITGDARQRVTLFDYRSNVNPLRVLLRKDVGGISIGLDRASMKSDPFIYRMLYARLPVVLRIFSQTGSKVKSFGADLSDGSDVPSGWMAFCSNRIDAVLVPDPVFFNSGGYAQFRNLSSMVPWSERDGIVLWRGTLTGIGAATSETMRADDPLLRQRTRMCLILGVVSGTNAKIHKIENNISAVDRERLARYGLIGKKIKQVSWAKHKFALDIDGHTNAWSNLFVRLLLGCCTLKISSQHGFQQWYYNKLKPWEHFVPVRADMSDLIEKIDWCRKHDDECARIARVGAMIVHSMTVEGEIRDAVLRLENASMLNVPHPPSCVGMDPAQAHHRGQMAGLRIAIVIEKLDLPGGKERDALAIAAGLAARGHSVTIVTRSACLKIPSGVNLSVMNSKRWTNHGCAWSFARQLATLRETVAIDAVLSFDKVKHADAYYAADVCFASRKLGPKKWLPRYRTYARLERDCLSTDGPDLLFLCRKQATEYQRHYPIDPLRIVVLPPMIHNNSNSQEFYERRHLVRQQLGIPESAPLAVSVALYSYQKGVDRTILMLHEIPELHIIVMGLKDTLGLQKLAAQQGVSARTRFLGYRDDVGGILGACDLMLHPARVENTGLVILESLLAGVPVIASAACGFSEYIECFRAGVVLSEPFDAAEYVKAIRASLIPDALANLKQCARESAPRLLEEGGLDRILEAIESAFVRRRERLSQCTAQAAR
jgi:glycosyltransferase involved in cell wall biosynthesis